MDTPGVGVMLGHGVEIVCGKKTWKVSPPDQDAKARLEKLAARTAIEEVRRLKDVLDPEAYQETFTQVTKTLSQYQTWRAGWQRVVFDPANAHLFLWSLLQANHPHCSEADVMKLISESPEEVAAAYAQILPGFFQMLLEPVLPNLEPPDRERVTTALEEMRQRLGRTPTKST